MENYDIAIIGTGPAGLEAAITAKLRNKTVLLLGSKTLSTKVEKAHTVDNYLGLPGVSGESMQGAFLDHLAKMDVNITEDKANAVYAMGSYFMIQGHSSNYQASSVILACGMTMAKPFDGEMENLGRGVSYCATCDAALYKNKSAIVICYSKEEEKEAAFLAEMAEQVTYLPMYGETADLKSPIKIMEKQRPVKISRVENKMELEVENGEQQKNILRGDGIFILRDSVAPGQLVPGLKMNGNWVDVDRSMKTNIAGLFACGDITGTPYQYIKSAGEGNVAALSAVNFLQTKK